MSIRCPGRLGSYELLRTLSSGGMGEVYLGRHSSQSGFASLVAIKVLLSHLTSQPTFVRMFLDEARAVARRRHEHVGRILDVDPHEGTSFMVMEDITGQNLRELIGDITIEDRPLFSPRLGALLFADLADALATVHRSGLVHRDISPNNIMVSDAGVAKLIDFGVVRALDDVSLTTPGTLKGKFGYMAPEYIRGQAYDQRVDLFSLGVVMWETFTRRRLFQSASAAEQIHRALQAEIPRVDQVLPRFPATLAEVVASMLDRDPDQRIDSANEVAERLSTFARKQPDIGESSVREWLEHRIPERMARRREVERLFMASSSDFADAGPGATLGACGAPASSAEARPPALAITHSTAANGESISRTQALPVRSTMRVLLVAMTVVILVLVAVVVRSRASEEVGETRIPAAARRPAGASAIQEHRTRGLAAMTAGDYDRAISEFADGLRVGGGIEFVDLLESARRHRTAATPSGSANPRPTAQTK